MSAGVRILTGVSQPPALPQVGSSIGPNDLASWDVNEVGFQNLRRRGRAVGRFPPFRSAFPAFAARSSRVQSNDKSGRSCSPS